MESNSDEPMSAAQARAQLDALAASRGTVAALWVTPAWYHPALAALVFVFVAGTSLEHLWVVTFTVYMLGLAVLVNAYRERTGVWVAGWNRRPGRGLAIVLLVVVVGAVITSLSVRRGALPWWWALVAAAMAAATTLWIGPRWDAAYRAGMRAQR